MVSAAFAIVNVRQSTHPLLVIVGLAPFILTLVYTSAIAQKFATLASLKDSNGVEFPVETFHEQLRLDAVENPPDDPSAQQKTPWKCLKCGESNPGNFDACWKCSSDEPTAA